MSIVEVAKVAGTSHATVSRVINNRRGVSPETAAAVQRAMEELGYTPPKVRRGPKPRVERTVSVGGIGLIWFGTDAAFARAPIASKACAGAERAAAQAGRSLLLCQIDREASELPGWVNLDHVDGLILHGLPPASRIAKRLRGYPSVWMLSPRAEEGFWGDRVMPDNRAVGRLAAEYLLGRGHRSLAYLLLDPTHYGFEARRSAFVATAERSGAEVLVATDSEASRELQTDPSFAVESIDRALGQIRAAPQRPTGLFVPSDQLVALVYGRLRAAGLEPQRDIDIISCDNEWTIDALYPKPATIDLRAELIGEVAVQQLLHRIEHPASEHVSATLTIDGYVVEPTESLSGAPNLPPDRVRAENAEAGASGVVPGEPEEHV